MSWNDSVERVPSDDSPLGRFVTPGHNSSPDGLSEERAVFSTGQDYAAISRRSIAPQYSYSSSTASSVSPSVFSEPSKPAVQTSSYPYYGSQLETYSNSNGVTLPAKSWTSTSADPISVLPDIALIGMASYDEAGYQANYTPHTSYQNSVASYPSISLDGTVPPHSLPDYRELEPYGNRLETRGIPCIFQDVLSSSCDENSYLIFEAYHEHILDHFGKYGPPKAALCMFCDRNFRSQNADKCWEEYVAHMWDHLCNGNEITKARPDFLTVHYLYDKRIISTRRYNEYCRRNTEDRGQAARSTEIPEEEPDEIGVPTIENPARKNRAKKEDRGGYNDHNGLPSSSSKNKGKRRK